MIRTWALLRWCSTKRRYIKCTYLYLYLPATLGGPHGPRCTASHRYHFPSLATSWYPATLIRTDHVAPLLAGGLAQRYWWTGCAVHWRTEQSTRPASTSTPLRPPTASVGPLVLQRVPGSKTLNSSASRRDVCLFYCRAPWRRHRRRHGCRCQGCVVQLPIRAYRQLRHWKCTDFWRGKLEANSSNPVSYGGRSTTCLAAAVYTRALLSISKRLISFSLRKLPAYN